MVRIPQYERSLGLAVASQPNVALDNSVGQGLGQLGAAITDVAMRAQQRQDSSEDFDARIGYAGLKQRIEGERQKALQEMPANATGFAASFTKRIEPITTQFVASLPKRLQPEFQARLGLDMDSFHTAVATDERDARYRFDTSAIKTAADTYQTRVMADPGSAPAALSDLEGLIDASPSFTPQQRAEAKQNVRSAVQTAQAQGMFPNAEAMAKAMGIPTGNRENGPVAATIKSAAAEIGTTPEDLAMVISYETGGRFSTSVKGGKGDNYLGLIQFGPEERAKYGVHAGQSFDEQMGAVVAFLKDRGFKPGMGLEDLYSTINAGSPGHYNASDGPGDTVLSHVAEMRRQHAGKVPSILGGASVPVGGDPQFSDIPFAKRLELVNWANARDRESQATYRIDVEQQVKDASSAYLTVGHYDGATPTPQDFVKAYEPERGPAEAANFASQHIDAVKTMTPDEQAAELLAVKPGAAGPGFADAQNRYDVLQKAIAVNQQQRAADPVAYVQTVFPSVKAAWDKASEGPDAFNRALRLTAETQAQIGIPPLQQKLIGGTLAKRAVDTFKTADAPEAQRLGAMVSTVLAADNPAQQSAIFRQLVDAGLPDMTEGAVRAFARGDQAAGERLMHAAIVDPKDLPGKIQATEADIAQKIQDEIMADGEVGDVAYGLSFGQTENLVSAERDGKLLTRSVQLRMAQGESWTRP